MFASFALSLSLLLAGVQDPEVPPGPQVGKPAPAFRLNDHEGNLVSSQAPDAKTWTVLAFFPKAATPG